MEARRACRAVLYVHEMSVRKRRIANHKSIQNECLTSVTTSRECSETDTECLCSNKTVTVARRKCVVANCEPVEVVGMSNP
jgi:hypothetical protein